MAWLKSKQESLADNLYDEQVHGIVASEIASGELVPGLWAKAFAQADGNEQQAKATYIKLRVDQLKLSNAAEVERTREAERLLIATAKKLSAEAKAGERYSNTIHTAKVVEKLSLQEQAKLNLGTPLPSRAARKKTLSQHAKYWLITCVVAAGGWLVHEVLPMSAREMFGPILFVLTVGLVFWAVGLLMDLARIPFSKP